MRKLLLAIVLMGCGSNKIGFDPSGDAGGGKDGGGDGSSLDGSVGPDGSTDPDGGTPSKPSMYTSGSRLKVKYYAGSDGSRSQIGLYDTTLQTTCYFGVSADASVRCLPVNTPSPYFSDAACTVRMALQTKGCAAPKYASFSTSGQGCPSTLTHIASVTGPVTPAKYYYLSGNTCSDFGAAPSTLDYYGIGAEVPPSAFVQGTEMQEP